MADETLHVTGLTPDPALTPPEPASVPAEPPPQETAEGVAQPAEQPAAAEEVPQDATAQTPAAPVEQASEGEVATPPKKPARGVQKALDRLAGQRDQAIEAAQRAAYERDVIAAAMQQLVQQGKQPQGQPAPQAEPPKPENYTNALDYQRAVAGFEAKQAAQQTVRQAMGQFVGALQQQANANAVQAQSAAINASYSKALEGAQERFADWEDTVISSQLPVPPSLELAIKGSNDPAAVLHYLASNPQVHSSLVNLAPWQQVYEVGRIAGQMTPRPVPSKAPPPAKPVGGKTSPAAPPMDDMSPAQYKAWLQKTGQTRGLR